VRKCKTCGKGVEKPDLRRSGFCSFGCKKATQPDKSKETIMLPAAPNRDVTMPPIKEVIKKKEYIRDSKYLAFIRTIPCLVCRHRGVVHAHHAETGGMGIKASDYTAIPLCVKHHTSGSDAVHNLGTGKFITKFNINLPETYKKLYEMYCTKNKKRVQ